MEFKSRYAWVANPDIPLCDLASLNWVSHRVPSSPALNYMQHLLAWQQTIVGTIPCARRVRTHTHTSYLLKKLKPLVDILLTSLAEI